MEHDGIQAFKRHVFVIGHAKWSGAKHAEHGARARARRRLDARTNSFGATHAVQKAQKAFEHETIKCAFNPERPKKCKDIL